VVEQEVVELSVGRIVGGRTRSISPRLDLVEAACLVEED
jgi:hypothetical protein